MKKSLPLMLLAALTTAAGCDSSNPPNQGPGAGSGGHSGGATGAAGSGGSASAPSSSGGSTGSAGKGGSTGSAGSAGTTAAAGSTGSAGAAGKGGSAGVTGSAGATGVAGTSGSAGVAGTSGSTGVAGTSGSTGVAGTSGSTGAAGTSGQAGTTGAAGSSGSGGGCSTADKCPAPKGGVTFNCEKRFTYGVNYAWAHFGGDFGGLSAWSQKGVAGEKSARTTDMTDMKNNGVDVIRWWMFPDLGGDGVKLDSSKTPTGPGPTLVDDIQAALDIAAQLDLHIKLTLFSFDSFFKDFTDSGVTFPSLGPIVTDDTKRAALIKNVIIPIAQAVESSPNKDRMVAWDVVNEPEWATSGNDGYGDQDFDPQSSGSNGRTMGPIPFAQMEAFVKDVVTALHANSKAPVTVGSAAVKWAKAWSKVGLDFYDFHWYGWVDQYFPHTKTPADYKVDDKPVVVGEFPLNPAKDTTGQSFGGADYKKLLDDWFSEGYAGAQGWAFSETSDAFSWSTAKATVKSWVDPNNSCYTHY